MYTYTNEEKKWCSYKLPCSQCKILCIVNGYNVRTKQNGSLPFGVIWSNNTCFRDEIVIHRYIQVMTNSKHALQNESKHQIMDVNMKWNCLTLILDKYYNYTCFRDENMSYKRQLHT